MWKMCLYVGIPGNVVQTRATRTKEWDAVAGYHNPDSGLIAISTDPQTWPRDGSGNPYWPVRTVDGRDSIRSQMDTYAVYRDRTNNRALVSDPPDWSQLLNIEVHQSTWAWNTSKDDDYIFFEFDIINDTTLAKDSVYFGLYTDLDAGGIVDIEFLVQYHVLHYADRHPGLTAYTDNMRILDCIRDLGLLDKDQVACLQDAYVFYRTLGHRQSLQGQSSVIDSGPELPYRGAVTAIWNQVMGG